MTILIDAAAVLILVLGFIYGYKKGLIKSVYSIASLVLTIAVVMVLQDWIVASMSAGDFAKGINQMVSDKAYEIINAPTSEFNEIISGLPSFMADAVPNAATATSAAADNIAAYVTTAFLRTVVCVLLFAAVKIVFALLFPIVGMIFRLPVIKNANSIGGGILSMINVLFAMYVLCGLAAVLFADKISVINDTYLVQFLYHNNILMQLIT